MLAPIALLTICAGMLGIFTFFLDPALQQMVPLSSWPTVARFLHDGIPALIMTLLSAALAMFAVSTYYR
ncbi:MAG: hypothetical protein RSD49_17515 [Hafnia sp.]